MSSLAYQPTNDGQVAHISAFMNITTLARKLSLAALAIFLGWFGGVGTSRAQVTTPAPLADYRFQNTLGSSVGTLGPLTTVGTVTYTYPTANVNGQNQAVFNVPAGGGLQTPASPFAASDQGTYSVVLLSAFNISGNVTTKVFDFKNLTTDAGLYINGATGFLQFIDNTSVVIVGGTGTVPVVTGTYFQLTLTRTAAGLVTGYQNGTQSFQFTDASNLATLNTLLTIFKDDNTGTAEDTSGNVARLRLYNEVLTADQVAALAVPEPASWVLLAAGGLWLGAVVRRHRRQAA